MDATDQRILEMLQRNSRMTSSEISKTIHLSVPAVAERIRKLESSGIIDRFTVKLNRHTLGQHCLAYIFVVIQGNEETHQFKTKIIESEYVLECHHTAGEYDYLLKVSLPDIQSLEQFITDILKNKHSVIRTNTVFVLSTLKDE
ncbi:Lrp/AsnC family transcriptional regulator [Paenibacillus medicaginis]|uniref:Lrp/AsnC family transcriptional regulator n=1 Tax=Paenibacillus medicaginis TaxID=1470560 RepID=A0ABV5C052_9BACL